METQMVNWLREYLKNTPPEQIKRDWEKIEQMNLNGPSALEYSRFLKETYSFRIRPAKEVGIKIATEMTPKFTGSFFLCNIAV